MNQITSDVTITIARAECHLCNCGKIVKMILITPSGARITVPVGERWPDHLVRLPGYGVKIVREGGLVADLFFD